MARNQHVVPHDGKWAVCREGASRATSVHRTQAEAVDVARQIARNPRAELVIHSPNGRIRSRDSHGNDRFPPRG